MIRYGFWMAVSMVGTGCAAQKHLYILPLLKIILKYKAIDFSGGKSVQNWCIIMHFFSNLKESELLPQQVYINII